MNGSVGSSRPKRQKQELAGSNGDVPASETESEDPVVGLAVRIVEFNHFTYLAQPAYVRFGSLVDAERGGDGGEHDAGEAQRAQHQQRQPGRRSVDE